MLNSKRDRSNEVEALLAGQPLFSIEILPATTLENIMGVGNYSGPMNILGNPTNHTLWNMRREGAYRIKRDLRLGTVPLRVRIEQDIFGYIRINCTYKKK
jgi:hypothetical protein